jgi:hypothetical protein
MQISVNLASSYSYLHHCPRSNIFAPILPPFHPLPQIGHVLDTRLHLRRNIRCPRRFRSAWSEEENRRPCEVSQLVDGR